MYDRHLCQISIKIGIHIFIINFHCSAINFKLMSVLFHVNKRQFYEGHFRNRTNESTVSRIIVDRCLKFIS